jgi:signal transduction histidine kinase
MSSADGDGDGKDKTTATTVAFVLGQVAHDLRTPVGSLALWLRLLREPQAEGADLGAAYGMVDGSLRSLSRFAADLEDAAQVVGGTYRLDALPLELNALVREVAARVEPQAAAKNVALRVSPGPGPVLLRADRERLGRALEALVGGALGRERQGGAVEVTVEGGAAPCLHITPPPVGPEGLPDLEHKLAPRPDARGGLALGLAMARHAIGAHGGGLQETGRGLTVSLGPLRAEG